MIATILLAAALSASPVRVIDGDTIAIGTERIRLLGIDAPELPGHCRGGRLCVPGDGQASKRHLEQVIASLGGFSEKSLKVTRIGHDRYGRTLGLVSAGGVDLSCAMIRAGQAVYKPRWDNGRRVAKGCAGVGR